MSTATEATGGPPAAGVDPGSGEGYPADPGTAPPDPGDLDERGRTTIADRVVQKIAAQAASDVEHATGAPRRVLGVHVSDDPRAPQVSAKVDGDVATVNIHLAVAWPASILDVTRQVRTRVVEQLEHLAGITHAQVDIDVSALTAEAPQERRVR